MAPEPEINGVAPISSLHRSCCGGACKQQQLCPCQFPKKLFESSETKVAFVGGGLSSIEGAKIAQQQRGVTPIILELSPFLGGIWQTSANHESRIQVDPVSFRPIDDTSPITPADPSLPFDTIYPDRQKVLERMAYAVKTHKLHEKTVFNVAVLGFEVLESEKKVRVRMRCYYGEDLNKVECACCRQVASEWGAKEFYYDFKELHIRTGSLTSWQHRGAHKFAGQDTCGSKVVAGIGNDISVSEFEGKNVVIIGMGAFSVENTRRAIQGGAKSITVLSRKFDKILFPEIATYFLRYTLQDEDAEMDENLLKMWRTVFKIVETGASATDLTKTIINSNCVRTVGGEKHFIFAKGLPSCASNTFMLAHKYGLVDIFEDEVATMVKGNDGIPLIHTKKGQTLPADITIKCMGFETDEGILTNHTVTDSYFVDGCSWVTHNLRADRVNGEGLIGPKVRVSNFLISYYEDAQEYERCIGRLIECPAAFEELQKMDPVKNTTLVSNVDYFSTLVLSEKLANNSDPVIQNILNENRETRQKMYKKYLPLETFIQHDKEMWDKICCYYSQLTGNKQLVPYPFEFLLE